MPSKGSFRHETFFVAACREDFGAWLRRLDLVGQPGKLGDCAVGKWRNQTRVQSVQAQPGQCEHTHSQRWHVTWTRDCYSHSHVGLSHDQVHQWAPVFPQWVSRSLVAVRVWRSDSRLITPQFRFHVELCTSNRVLTFKLSLQRFVKRTWAPVPTTSPQRAPRFGKDQILSTGTKSC